MRWRCIFINDKNKHVLIFSPVSDREKYLPHYLNRLVNLNYPKENISFYFIVNNSQDSSLQILNEFKRENQTSYRSIKIDISNSKQKFKDERTTKIRNQFTYSHLSNLRNQALDYSKTKNVDYLFSIDSDILVKSNSLKKLIDANKPIVSSLIYNGYLVSPESPWKYTNIMNVRVDNKIEHISNWYVKNSETLPKSKVIPVDVTGAISLIRNDVIKSGAKYGFHLQGEDILFSLDAKTKGFQSYCDLSCFSYHCMNEELLLKFSNTK